MLNRQTAVELARGLQSGALTATRVALACLERIEAREAQIGAWSYLDREQVLSQARELDSAAVRGPLHGLPVGIKDIIATADMPTEYGSSIYAGHRPAWDAACVAAIRAAGGLVMGKTVTTEFASMHPGKTVNPHNGAHTPGGSSSGSAAGVADFMMPLALGTQTGGSLIRPASFCGVVGYKPSFGLISRHGVKPLAESLDTVGLFARCVADAGLLSGVIACRPELVSIRPSRPSRVGLWRTFEWKQASQESIVAVEETARLLAESGAEVRVADMPQDLAALDDTHHTMEWFEMVDALSYELQRHSTGLSARMRERLAKGEAISAEDYEAALRSAVHCRQLMRDVFTKFDVLLTPSAPGEAPKGVASTGSAVFNRGWTLLQLPCITLPGFLGPQGLPVGIQLVGPLGKDAQLLGMAAWTEQLMMKRAT